MASRAREYAAFLAAMEDDELRDYALEWADARRDLVELELESDGAGDTEYWRDLYPDGGRPAPLLRYPDRGISAVKTCWRQHERRIAEADAWLAACDGAMDRRGIDGQE